MPEISGKKQRSKILAVGVVFIALLGTRYAWALDYSGASYCEPPPSLESIDKTTGAPGDVVELHGHFPKIQPSSPLIGIVMGYFNQQQGGLKILEANESSVKAQIPANLMPDHYIIAVYCLNPIKGATSFSQWLPFDIPGKTPLPPIDRSCFPPPFFRSANKSSGPPDDIVELHGQWPDTQGSMVPTMSVMDYASNTPKEIFPMNVVSWSSSVVSARLPSDMKDGSYLLSISCRDSSGTIKPSRGGQTFEVGKTFRTSEGFVAGAAGATVPATLISSMVQIFMWMARSVPFFTLIYVLLLPIPEPVRGARPNSLYWIVALFGLYEIPGLFGFFLTLGKLSGNLLGLAPSVFMIMSLIALYFLSNIVFPLLAIGGLCFLGVTAWRFNQWSSLSHLSLSMWIFILVMQLQSASTWLLLGIYARNLKKKGWGFN